MDFSDLGLDFAGIQFYKPLASSLHPAGAFSSVETAFLKIFNMHYIIFEDFLKDSRIYKPWVSKLHPAGAFFLTKIAHLNFLHMGLAEKTKFFSREVVVPPSHAR